MMDASFLFMDQTQVLWSVSKSTTCVAKFSGQSVSARNGKN